MNASPDQPVLTSSFPADSMGPVKPMCRASVISAWDRSSIHRELARLTLSRALFRVARTLKRIRSPRRIAATTLAVLFFSLYVLNGIFILSSREPADPERLRLWLSGGMVLYAVYHCVRCAWSQQQSELELTAAEQLWLGGAPIHRSSLAVYHVGSMLVPAMLKTVLLSVILARDVAHFELLVVGVLTSLLLLEISRLIVARWASGLDASQRSQFRIATAVIATAAAAQVITHVLARTPMGSATWVYVLNFFQGLGATASCTMVHWMSAPWISAANLSVTENYQWLTVIQLASSAAVIPLAILVLVRVDAWSGKRQRADELARLESHCFKTRQSQRDEQPQSVDGPLERWVQRWAPTSWADAVTIALRQWVSVRRYYRAIVTSFAIPTLLCLSPLLTGQTAQQWLFVVGGVALCTMLLAPPALRIDFRRDLRRMLLLRLLPVKHFSMVLGQLAIPITITWIFQWVTVAIAAIVTRPDAWQVLLWTGMLNALAVFTFALENALFLSYPHFERAEGVAMMIRTKLTFLGKATLISIALGLLFTWATLCRKLMPAEFALPTLVAGALLATWTVSVAAMIATAYCWRRFDLASDTPPE